MITLWWLSWTRYGRSTQFWLDGWELWSAVTVKYSISLFSPDWWSDVYQVLTRGEVGSCNTSLAFTHYMDLLSFDAKRLIPTASWNMFYLKNLQCNISLALFDNSNLICSRAASGPYFSSIVFNAAANGKTLVDGGQTTLSITSVRSLQ